MIEIDFSKIDTTKAIPEQEPNRQYYFIAKVKEEIAKKSKALGRLLTFYTQTFGCQMNFKDSEKLSGILEAIGFLPAEDEKADFVVYNTCTVRENANSRVYGRIGYLGKLKKTNPMMMIAMCGCMMQEAHAVEKIKTSYRFVDIIFGTHNIFKLAELIYEKLQAKRMIIDVWKGTDEIVEELPSDLKYSFKAGVNIMYGCNNFCSYCIVPYVRGRERSRKPEDIVKEVKELAGRGVVEIMLLGQNVNSYGASLTETVSFAALLRRLEEIEGIQRIRFMTSHPKDLSMELIEVMRDSKKICKHLHLPLQSGSSKLLKQMNRHYTKEDYLDLTKKIKEAIPGIALTTDLIVGFPGETEEDFRDTLEVVKEVGFDSAYTFLYSKRTGTPAATMENQVPEDIAKKRFSRLLETIQKVSKEAGMSLVKTAAKVLVEEEDVQQPGFLTGRLENNRLVHFKGEKSDIGRIISVFIRESKGFYYFGEK